MNCLLKRKTKTFFDFLKNNNNNTFGEYNGTGKEKLVTSGVVGEYVWSPIGLLLTSRILEKSTSPWNIYLLLRGTLIIIMLKIVDRKMNWRDNVKLLIIITINFKAKRTISVYVQIIYDFKILITRFKNKI